MTRSSPQLLVASLVLAALAGGCRTSRHGRPDATCAHVQSVRETQGLALCEDAWTCVRPPGGRFDRVGLHRLAPCESATGPLVLYLAGMHMNGELPITDPRYDLRLHLATAGARTWGLDYRTHAVPPDASPADLEALARWDAGVFTDDAAWAARFIESVEPGPLYVAGFSHGATLAYALTARRDPPLAGLVILDGALPSGRSADAGAPAIDVGGARLPFALRQQLLADVVADPDRPSPLPGFATAGAALAEVLYAAPSFGGHGGLANVRGGVSDVRVVAQLLQSYDRWWPRAALASSAPAAPHRPLRVLAFASTNLGPEWVERVRSAAHSFGGPDATVRELRGYGHLDVLVAETAAHDVFGPTLAWLEGNAVP